MKKSVHTRVPRADRTRGDVAEVSTVTTLGHQLPSSLTDLLGTSVARARDAHQKVTSIVEHTISSGSRVQAEYRAKMFEIARANTNAAFDLARDICGAKAFSNLVEAAVTYQRRQFETTAAQTKELSGITQKLLTRGADGNAIARDLTG